MRTIRHIHTATDAHWVGNGFPVSTMFSYFENPQAVSPFLLLDYAGPVQFGPAQRARGVDSHPHKGFETVTLVYHGEVAHRDSTGQGGVIGPGDVQWMTAGSGILHEEFHSDAFAKSGGTLEMVQLWVNLPAEHKATPANYQSLEAATMPFHQFDALESSYRVVAGTFNGVTGPARIMSDLLVMDLNLVAGESIELPFPKHWNLMMTTLTGTVLVNQSEIVRDASLVSFANHGDSIHLEANNDSRLLVTAGAPLNEPVVGYGPFVMNTEEEIAQAIKDFA
ncbi:pirin family protein [Aliidiomarina soli]|uniref:Quercetin 2,3-dioxygenase n=1 Tax=Aliidiomarina soli TaxID=1928574 RepID=A0A432WDZ3_9GAMM|nr:pirin family protein [Aliidiomarina soli]RUO31082.1 quercetin 2,3-dioxygenase [Aliidiomarina soli]